MKLEYKSKNILALTKSKAKFYEFDIHEEHHGILTTDPNKLLVLAIGILGEISALDRNFESLSNIDVVEYEELKSQLIFVAQYFDALDHSKIEPEMSVYLKIVGSAAYYLADMPGSSSVLAKTLTHEKHDLTHSSIEGPLIWMLRASRQENTMGYCSYPEVNNIIFSYVKFINQVGGISAINMACKIAQKLVYEHGTDRELFFIDIIVAVTKRRIENSSIVCLPKFTGIAIEKWSPILAKRDFISEFWPAQRLLGREDVLRGKSAVIQMPTSAGKTKSTELIIRSAFIGTRANLAVIVAPFRALCREISDSFKKAFENENVSINELLDAPQLSENDNGFLRFLLGDKFKDPSERKTVMVSTPEKLVYLLRHKPELAERIGLLIFDEGHQFDTGLRGVTYELLVASLRAAVSENTQLVLISAVISNAKTIGDWLYGERGTNIQGAHCIPTVRSVAFASWQENLGQLNYLDSESISEREFIVPRIIDQINLGKRGRERDVRFFPSRSERPSIPAYLGLRLCQQGAVAIFCGTKASVNAICSRIIEAYGRGLEMSSPLEKSNRQEISKIGRLAECHFGNDDVVYQSIMLGVLPHSASVPNGLRVSVEWAMANNMGCFVVCTSTLSQGVNLPIRYLIVSTISQAGEDIKKRDFHNLMGRAGRSGYHTEGSVIFSDVDIYEKRFSYGGKWKWDKTLELLSMGDGDICISSLKEVIAPCKILMFPWNVLDFIADPDPYRLSALNLAMKLNEDPQILVNQIHEIEKITQKIESFMLSYLKDNPQISEISVFGKLAIRTLAYHMSTPDERLLLVKVFEKISERVLAVDKDKISYYGQALLGIAQLEKIEDWANENRFQLALCFNMNELLQCCWPLIKEMALRDIVNRIFPESAVLAMANGWIDGKSYRELHNIFLSSKAYSQAPKRKMPIKISTVVDLADGAMAYDSMLIVGALADIVDGSFNNETLAGELRSLQLSLKLGLKSNFEKWLYSEGYADREICKKITEAFSLHGADLDDVDYQTIKRNPELLKKVLVDFPSYFSEIHAE